MGPEVDYFPNVSAICGTLQLNALIAVPGSECQRTGSDGAANSELTGGAPAPPLLGNHSGPLRVQQAGTMGLCGVGTRSGPVRGPVRFVCAHLIVPGILGGCSLRTDWDLCMVAYACPPSPCVTTRLYVHAH